MDIRETLFTQYGIRNSYSEKRSFRNYICKVIQFCRYEPIIQKEKIMGFESNNVIAGSVAHCKTIFFAAYDTPKRRLVPTVKYIGSPFANVIGRLLPPLILLIFFTMFTVFLKWPVIFSETLFLLSLFMLYYLVPNKNNANCTNSSVVLLHKIMEDYKGDPNTAFVFLDNSDPFSLGKHVFFKRFGEECKSKNLVFLELVGKGDYICLSYSKNAEPAVRSLPADNRWIVPLPDRRSAYTSIRVNCARKNNLGYYIDSIMSPADTRLDEDCINAAMNAVEKLIH